jgi:fluoride exporter
VEYVWVGLGGLVGAVARFAVGKQAAERLGTAFPYGTLLVNVTGSLAIGLVVAFVLARVTDPAWRLLLVAGFLGGYTTFSAFAFEAVALLQDGRWGRAVLYVLASNLIGLAACWGGLALGRGLVR